ncbi:uncharacterized protein [Amphiura filiformis]|uniref:uncharacterized protein n=1 Tax=Amphiura filiformis TaxID=82378 RepID=UPI003B215819
MEEIKDRSDSVKGMSAGVQPLQTEGSGLWNMCMNDSKVRNVSSSPPLQASDRSATSSTSVSWNIGESVSSVEVSDHESFSSPEVQDLQGQVIYEITKESATSVDVQLTEGIGAGRVIGNNSTSWMNNAETCLDEDRAAFDRVVGDAPQRAHIRLKSRHHRLKGDKESDGSSDSSSYNRDSPPTILNLSNIGVAKQQDGNLESEGSSGSGTFFRPTTQNATKHFKHGKPKSDNTQSQSDAGIATCGSSTSRQSNLSMSRYSSGIDAGDSGFGTARKSTCKRSLSTHYQNIKHGGVELDAETSNSSTMHNIRTVPEAEPDTDRERKRRRFNRTFAALRQCGLLDLTLQTATLMEQSQRMQKQLETLRKETKALHGAMRQFSEVQPTFLQTNNAQKVMTNLEQIANGEHENSPVKKFLEETETTTTQLLHGALSLHQKILERQANEHSPPKKLKQKHSASSSQTLTSTSSPTTDSDELQKQYGEIQGFQENLKLSGTGWHT